MINESLVKAELKESGLRNMEQIGWKRTCVYNLVCFGFMPWGNMWKRNQSMMAELAKLRFIGKLLFINPRISLKNKLSNQINPVHGQGVVSTVFPKTINSKIMVYTPITWLPLKRYFPKLMMIEDQITLKTIRFLSQGEPYILFLNCPNFSSDSVLDELVKNARLTIFDFSDDFPELGYDKLTKEAFRNRSVKYAKKADLVLTVNEHIKQKYAHINANIHVIRNATNFENFDRSHFDPLEKLEVIKRAGNPIIGYSGIANLSRIDSDILDELIHQKTAWQFVFVGPAQPNFIERYSPCNNVHLWGSVKYSELPNVIRYFDVAIVPFFINDHTKGNDLLKLYDYLALGKPVVSTPIGGAWDLKEVVYLANTPFDFSSKVEKALHSKDSNDVMARKYVAKANSWSNRIHDVESVICTELQRRSQLLVEGCGRVVDASTTL